MNATRSYQCSQEFHSCQPATPRPTNGRKVMRPVSVRSSFWVATGWTSSRATTSSAGMAENLPVLEDPTTLAQNRDRRPVRGDAIDLELRRAHHEVGMSVGLVHPGGVRLVDGEVVERPGDAVAPGDMGGRVLVE